MSGMGSTVVTPRVQGPQADSGPDSETDVVVVPTDAHQRIQIRGTLKEQMDLVSSTVSQLCNKEIQSVDFVMGAECDHRVRKAVRNILFKSEDAEAALEKAFEAIVKEENSGKPSDQHIEALTIERKERSGGEVHLVKTVECKPKGSSASELVTNAHAYLRSAQSWDNPPQQVVFNFPEEPTIRDAALKELYDLLKMEADFVADGGAEQEGLKRNCTADLLLFRFRVSEDLVVDSEQFLSTYAHLETVILPPVPTAPLDPRLDPDHPESIFSSEEFLNRTADLKTTPTVEVQPLDSIEKVASEFASKYRTVRSDAPILYPNAERLVRTAYLSSDPQNVERLNAALLDAIPTFGVDKTVAYLNAIRKCVTDSQLDVARKKLVEQLKILDDFYRMMPNKSRAFHDFCMANLTKEIRDELIAAGIPGGQFNRGSNLEKVRTPEFRFAVGLLGAAERSSTEGAAYAGAARAARQNFMTAYKELRRPNVHYLPHEEIAKIGMSLIAVMSSKIDFAGKPAIFDEAREGYVRALNDPKEDFRKIAILGLRDDPATVQKFRLPTTDKFGKLDSKQSAAMSEYGLLRRIGEWRLGKS